MSISLARRTVAEFLGTAFLVAAVVGSGIMGDRLAGGNVAIALLANTIATGAALVALILTFGPISGAHFNPVVTIADAWEGGIPWRETSHYVLAQVVGGISGAAGAHLMFGLSVISISQHTRGGPAQWWSEFVATFGLLSVIWGCSRLRPTGSLLLLRLRILQSQSLGVSLTPSQVSGPSMCPGLYSLSSSGA